MGNFTDKFRNMLGLEPKDDYIEEEADETFWGSDEEKKYGETDNVSETETEMTRNDSGAKMILIKAKAFNEVRSIAHHLKENRSVIVNLEQVEKEVAQRMIDFLSGTVYALGGIAKKVSADTVLFATNNVDLSGQIPTGIDIDKEEPEKQDTENDIPVFKPTV